MAKTILVINPNSTEEVTRGIDEACAPLRIPGGPAIETATLAEGPPGVETQQQWSPRAIARTTPARFGLFSLVTLLAHHRLKQGPLAVPTTAWYAKPLPTFVDALALVRRDLWPVQVFTTSPQPAGVVEIPRSLWDRLTSTLAYAA